MRVEIGALLQRILYDAPTPISALKGVDIVWAPQRQLAIVRSSNTFSVAEKLRDAENPASQSVPSQDVLSEEALIRDFAHQADLSAFAGKLSVLQVEDFLHFFRNYRN